MNTSSNMKVLVLSAALMGACSSASAAYSNVSPYVMSPGWESLAATSEFQFKNAEQVANKQGLSVVVLGSDKFRAKFGIAKSIGSFSDNSKGKQIVIMESDGQDADTIMKLLARGNIAIAVGATSVNKAMSAMEMLADISASGKLQQKSAAAYDENQLMAYGEDSAGNKTQGIVSAYSYVPGSPSSFDTTEQNVQIALAQAIDWATEAVEKAKIPRKKAYNYVEQRQLTVNCTSDMSIYGGSTAEPVGTLINYVNTYRDGTSRRWGIQFTTEMTIKPGWANSNLITYSDVNARYGGFNLQSTSPGNTSGTSTVTLGFNASGAFGSASYSVQDVSITNNSSFTTEEAKWTHNIRESTSAGTARQEFRPIAEILLGATYSSIAYKIGVSFEGQWWRKAVNGTETCKGALSATQ